MTNKIVKDVKYIYIYIYGVIHQLGLYTVAISGSSDYIKSNKVCQFTAYRTQSFFYFIYLFANILHFS